jgi:hypothetical protein
LVDLGVLSVHAEETKKEEEKEDGAVDEDFGEDFGHYDERKFSLIIKCSSLRCSFLSFAKAFIFCNQHSLIIIYFS